jgi:ribonuclease J
MQKKEKNPPKNKQESSKTNQIDLENSTVHHTHQNDLLFLPLGGSNEIGMNVNLYRYKGKWLMVDLGAGFAHDRHPGCDMLAPDLSFIKEHKKDLVGIVFTHAHEDHIGSVGYLYKELGCPIYATPFSAEVAKYKLAENGQLDKAKIIEIQPNSTFNVGPFELEFIQITHSIPEMNAVVIKTEYGKVLHTGDWKFDPEPVEGPLTNEKALKALGKEGALAIVCDSTNVFNPKHSGSEGDLEDSFYRLLKGKKGMVVVSTFASNVARMHTIAKIAKKLKRKVVIAGWSMRRISTIAKQTGYLTNLSDFHSDKELKHFKRDEVLVLCTGCQGETRAAMSKIARGEHPNIKLSKQDTVVFSSKIIPGNERKIFDLFNKFVHLGCEVVTEKDHKVHVSGHPSREELAKMYSMVRPNISIPVHGEPVHLAEHIRFAKDMGVKFAVQVKNGAMVRIAPGNPHVIKQVKTGYLAVDGRILQPDDGEVMTLRRRMRDEGIIFVTIVLDKQDELIAEPAVAMPGVIDHHIYEGFLNSLSNDLAITVDNMSRKDYKKLFDKCRSVVRKKVEDLTGKTPLIEFQILRV